MPDYLVLAQAIVRFLEDTDVVLADCPALRAGCTPDYWTKVLGEEQTDAQKRLNHIAEILDRETTDFDCIEDLVVALHTMGYVTCRHDFG